MEAAFHAQVVEPVLTVGGASGHGPEHLVAFGRLGKGGGWGAGDTDLISITFLTVCEAIQFPAVARESVATIIPPWKRKARVVVPWASLMGQLGLVWSSVTARRKAEGWKAGAGEVSFCGVELAGWGVVPARWEGA